MSLNFDPVAVTYGGIIAGLLGLFFWMVKRMHSQAIAKLDEVVKANHATSLIVARHDEKITQNSKAIDTAHRRLDTICNTPA